MRANGKTDQRFSTDSLRDLMDEVAHLQIATTFHITDGTSERIFYFVRSGVRLLSTGPRTGPGLPGHLLETGRIDVDTLHEVLEENRNRKKDLRKILIDKGILQKDECNRIVSQLIRDELLDLVFWDGASFIVHTQDPPEDIFKLDRPALHGSVDNRKFAADVIAWLDAWTTIRKEFPSDGLRVRTTGAAEDTALREEPVRRLLSTCRDEQPLRHVWRVVGWPLDQLLSTLVELRKQGLVELTSDASSGKRTPQEEIEELEDGLHHLIAKDLVRERLVTLYRQLKRPARAVEHLEALAESALTAKSLPRAIEHYKLILSLQPHNVGAFERLLAFTRETSSVADIRRFSLQHLQHLLKRSLRQEAEQCTRALESFPDVEIEVLEFKAALLASRGQQSEAAEEYRRAAEQCDDKGETARAVRLLEQAIEHDGNNAAAHEHLELLRRRAPAAEPPSTSSVATELIPKASLLPDVQVQPTAESSTAAARALLEVDQRRGGPGRGLSPELVIAAVAIVALVLGLYFFFSGPSVPQEEEGTALAETGRAARGEGTDSADEGAASASTMRDRRGGDARRAAPNDHRGAAEPTGENGAARNTSSRGPVDWALPEDPCDPANLLTRVLDDMQRALYRDSCDLVIQRENGKLSHHFPGRRGTRWAFGHRGRFVCRWEAGDRPTVFATARDLEIPLTWRVPNFTDALAVANDRIIIREGGFTAVFTFSGTPVATAQLPAWEEGVVIDDRLILSRFGSAPRALWVVKADTLDLIWSCTSEPDRLVIR